MIRAYLYALEPTPAQVEQFRSHCGAQRFAYNWALERVLANINQRAAERSYDVIDLTPIMQWSAYDLRRMWNQAKAVAAPWWVENSKEVYAAGCANLAAALSNWKSSMTGHRKGCRVAFPRFKSRSHLSCKFLSNGSSLRLGDDRRHVNLPRIGLVRTSESTRKLARRIGAGTASIRSATLSYQRGRWHISFSVELPDLTPLERTSGRGVGIDLGIKTLAVLSTGEMVPNPRHFDVILTELRRAQRRCARRKGPDRQTSQSPSNRWRKARIYVDLLHTRVANQRRAGLHALTARLVRDFDTIVIEDLNVAGMVRNHRLARHIQGLSLGELRRQLTYKAADAGVKLIVADRWYPSSKTCSACGVVRAKLTLAERMFHCESCGFRLDRDLNAARNLAALADQAVLGELRPDVKRPDGNACQTGLASSAYCHGKTPVTEPTPHREVMAS